jgi:hypothetical protein
MMPSARMAACAMRIEVALEDRPLLEEWAADRRLVDRAPVS